MQQYKRRIHASTIPRCLQVPQSNLISVYYINVDAHTCHSIIYSAYSTGTFRGIAICVPQDRHRAVD